VRCRKIFLLLFKEDICVRFMPFINKYFILSAIHPNKGRKIYAQIKIDFAEKFCEKCGEVPSNAKNKKKPFFQFVLQN
jgi:hypothetical protein